MTSIDLSGKRCLITGAGRGIGRQLALDFARAGAAVAALDRDPVPLGEVVAAINSANGSAVGVALDLAHLGAIPARLEALMQSFGTIDILVNNAAVVVARSFVDTSLDELETMLRINLQAPFVCAQVVAKAMLRQKSGRIINMASHSGMLGSSNRAGYAASKGGILGATRVMAVELAPHGITVNAIAPGPIESAHTRTAHTGERRAAWNDAVPVGRYGEAVEVSAAALFLASPQASYITGQTLAVDGGFTAAGLILKNAG